MTKNMLDRTDAIIDFETWGQDSNTCALIDMSVLVFNWAEFEQGVSFETLLSRTERFKFNADEQKALGWGFEPETINFWSTTPKETRIRIVPSQEDRSLNNVAESLIFLLQSSPKIEYWWSRSNNFDPPILHRLMRHTGQYYALGQYLQYQRLRDTRTWIDAKFNWTVKPNGFIPVTDHSYWNETFRAHNSQHDIAADTMRLQMIARAEADLPPLER